MVNRHGANIPALETPSDFAIFWSDIVVMDLNFEAPVESWEEESYNRRHIYEGSMFHNVVFSGKLDKN